MDTTQTETIATAADHRLPGCTAVGLKTSFEKKLCGRCGGSGSYSYCASHGTRCFGCGGLGETHTKRGAAAFAYLGELRSVRADEIVVGDIVADSSGRWHTVVSVGVSSVRSVVDGEPVDGSYLAIECKNTGMHVFPDTAIRVRCSAAQAALTLAAALRYQATLTATGKPRGKR